MLWQLLFAERHPLDMDAYVKAHMEFVMSGLERVQASESASAPRLHDQGEFP